MQVLQNCATDALGSNSHLSPGAKKNRLLMLKANTLLTVVKYLSLVFFNRKKQMNTFFPS
jgi:hypothetical protein